MTLQEPTKRPDSQTDYGFLGIGMPDNNFAPTALLNEALRAMNIDRRARVIVTPGDSIAAAGVWTLLQEKIVAKRLEYGTDGEIHDPKERKGLARAFQYFGLIE